MSVSADQMLVEVDTAITKILVGGQSYKIGSRQLTRADLNLLYKMKSDLTTQIASSNATGLLDDSYVAEFEGR
jgi:hypothetical protein